jgi:FkbM family methyltransferase
MNIKKTISYDQWEFNFDWIEHDHYTFTSRQFDKVKFIASIIQNPKVIFDIGANIGMYSVFFRYFYPDSTIYSFEALKDTADICKLNTKNYNINVFDYGIWDSNTTLELGVPKGIPLQSTNYGFYWDFAEGHNKKVEVKTLDSVISDLGVVPEFIKIDVEGGEINVINGCLENIKHVKYVMVESVGSNGLPDPKNVHDLLCSLGFRLYHTIDHFDKIYINSSYE